MRISNITGIILAIVLFAGCQKDEWVKIDSLMSDGNEFFTNQKVKLWMAVQASHLPDVTYEWRCDSGRLTQPQGLDEMTWQSPKTPGTYKIYCTVKIGDKSETRVKEMYVSSFFFEKFEKSSYAFKGQSSTTLNKRTDTINGVANGYLEATMKSTSSSNRYIYYNFGDPNLKIPFSCSARIGWISDFPTASIKVGSSTFQNKLYYEVTLNRDPDKEDVIYVDRMRFEWYPVGVTTGLPLDPVTGQAYNGSFSFEVNNLGSTQWRQVSVNVPELTFTKGQNKRVSLNLGSDYVVHIYVDGTEIITTDAIQQWRTTNGSKDDIYIGEWRLIYPNGNGGNKPPKIYFDDAYARIDGGQLK